MNVDELRTALHEEPPVPLTVDLDRVLARGRRRRAARRATVPVAVLATAAAVAVPVVVLGDNGAGEAETSSPAATTAAPSRSSRPTPAAVIPGALPRTAFADVIGTGERVAGTERVFRFFPTEPDAQLQTRFILGLAYRAPGGGPKVVGGTNEIQGRDDATGFHATTAAWYGMVLPPGDWAVFGYYAGPATRITAVVDGRTVTAKTARWPGYPRIVVFWLSPGTGSPKPTSNTAITDLRAYDADGRPLPAGPYTQVSAG